MGRRLWQGATVPMVLEMLGEPADRSHRVFKTKTKETWRYHHLGGHRYVRLTTI